jgi:hypothetical protein
MTYQLFELFLVDFVCTSECVHVEFYEVDLRQVFWKVETGVLFVVDFGEALRERTEHEQLLSLEPVLVRLFHVLALPLD